jgi:DNA-3-methyladenine glycosylase II
MERLYLKPLTDEITYKTDSPEIQALCEADARLTLVIKHYGDLSYTPHSDPFAHTVENIIGQMLSNKAADAIATRLYKLCGGELKPVSILRLDIPSLRGIGLSGQKSEYIMLMAELLNDNPNFFDTLVHLPDIEVIKKLTALRGIGPWSAKMYLIFVLNRLDVLPYEDGAFLQAYKWLYETDNVKPPSIIERCRMWKPYSSLAARYLYRALDSGLTRDANLRIDLGRLS